MKNLFMFILFKARIVNKARFCKVDYIRVA